MVTLKNENFRTSKIIIYITPPWLLELENTGFLVRFLYNKENAHCPIH